MHAKDISKVLSGARLVLEQIANRHGPEVAWRIERAGFHLSELSKVVTEIVRESNPNISESSHRKSSGRGDNAAAPKVHFDDGTVESFTNKIQANNVIDKVTSNTEVATAQAIDANAPNSNIESNSTTDVAEINLPSRVASTGEATAEKDLIGFSEIENTSTSNHEANSSPAPQGSSAEYTAPHEQFHRQQQQIMRERAVPATQIGRMFGFGSLAVRMAMGEAFDRASHAFDGSSSQSQSANSSGLSDDNAERLAEALCRMRGAALKLGQMLSIQEDGSLPPALSKALDRVKQSADYMPKRQLEAQLEAQLGKEWNSRLLEFESIPIAAASIGQVHKARLLDGTEVAMKIQYPGVAESINSDLVNLKRVVSMTNLLPPGLFIDNIIAVAGKELKDECDYIEEARNQHEYREKILNDPVLRKHINVPEVYLYLTTSRVLTTRLVPGVPIDQATSLSQAVRNAIARTLLIKTIRELFEWRFIQSDPNFANFLYDDATRTIHMIDFGAARRYEKSFVDGYMRLVWAAANKDRDTIFDVSKELTFITGDETKEFIDAHVDAGLVVGEPFLEHAPFDFGNSRLTARISSYGDTFMKYRLTPPPSEAYSLHRKLAGAFLLCIKLKANIPCRDILEDTFKQYRFGEETSDVT